MIRLNNQTFSQPATFPDGTQKLSCIMSEWDLMQIPSVVDITWNYEREDELVTLYFLVNHLRDLSVDVINLNMPYIPNARFDRTQNKDEVFTLKYFAKFINDLHFASVKVLDPHSHVSEALFDRLHVQQPNVFIEQALENIYEMQAEEEAPILFFPDEGAMKRYASNPITKDRQVVFGIKQRDWKTGQILNLQLAGDVAQLQNKPVLIIDDICSRGGTFYHSAKALKEAGAGPIYLYVSHCENTILEGELLSSGYINRVYTTDSIFTKEHPMITVFS